MKAILALEDGSVFHGEGFGARASASGEVCFNTSMTGYQEILTDPSYKGQIVTMTYPLIGNYGVNEVDVESWRPHAAGFVIRELSPVVSNWRADFSLGDYLQKNGIPGIQGIDTRALTKKLRVRGAMNGFISTEKISATEAVKRAREFVFVGVDYVQEVTHKKAFRWDEADQQSARPGYSEHQTGFAADVGPVSQNCALQQCFGDTPEGKWLAANAYKYGFIIRYAADDQDITGYEAEPWHIRYVGTELSTQMHTTGIKTLEQFFNVPGGAVYRN